MVFGIISKCLFIFCLIRSTLLELFRLCTGHPAQRISIVGITSIWERVFKPAHYIGQCLIPCSLEFYNCKHSQLIYIYKACIAFKFILVPSIYVCNNARPRGFELETTGLRPNILFHYSMTPLAI